MNQTKFTGLSAADYGAADSSGQGIGAPASSGRLRESRLMSWLWLVLAWIVGTLVCEIASVGAQSPTLSEANLSNARLGELNIDLGKSLDQDQTNACLAHAALPSLYRLERNHRLKPQIEQTIRTESQYLAEHQSVLLMQMTTVDRGVDHAANVDSGDLSRVIKARFNFFGKQQPEDLLGIKQVTHASDLFAPLFVDQDAPAGAAITKDGAKIVGAAKSFSIAEPPAEDRGEDKPKTDELVLAAGQHNAAAGNRASANANHEKVHVKPFTQKPLSADSDSMTMHRPIAKMANAKIVRAKPISLAPPTALKDDQPQDEAPEEVEEIAAQHEPTLPELVASTRPETSQLETSQAAKTESSASPAKTAAAAVPKADNSKPETQVAAIEEVIVEPVEKQAIVEPPPGEPSVAETPNEKPSETLVADEIEPVVIEQSEVTASQPASKQVAPASKKATAANENVTPLASQKAETRAGEKTEAPASEKVVVRPLSGTLLAQKPIDNVIVQPATPISTDSLDSSLSAGMIQSDQPERVVNADSLAAVQAGLGLDSPDQPAVKVAVATHPPIRQPDEPTAPMQPQQQPQPAAKTTPVPLVAPLGQPEERIAAAWPFSQTPTPKLPGQASVSLSVDNADVRTVFEMLARGHGMNILVSPDVAGVVTANVDGLTAEQTLHGVLKMCNLRAQVQDDVIMVYPADKLPSDARQLRLFPLDFARSETVDPTVQGLLSPIGNAYTSVLDAKDNLKTREAIVVVDTPESIRRIESYIFQVDQPPRQVMIEARVLEVELSDTLEHGIDFTALRNKELTIGTTGLTSAAAAGEATFYAGISGDEVTTLIELLETTTDAKTLASPKIMVVNGQQAKIQVGQQLGFTVATVTQTSTIQDVQFLDTGVVLSVRPTISRDNKVLMEVKPEVSNGQINPETLLPEEETRELETSVLLSDHQGMIIGGLIQETDRTVIKKLPWLGDVRHVGKFFQRRQAIRSRSEIIVALVPHIVQPNECVNHDAACCEEDMIDYQRTTTPLLQGPLQRTCRPWESRLPDTVGAEKHYDVNKINRMMP